MYNQSPRRHNTRGELPRASAASLFDSGMNNGPGLNQFNQVQFDSFINEQQQTQTDPFSSPMSLPSFSQAAVPPSDNISGPPSLEGNALSNPYRSKGRGGRARQYNTASTLFGAAPQPKITQPFNVSQETSQAESFQPTPSQNQKQQLDAVPMDSFFQPSESQQLTNTHATAIMPVSQPEGFAEYEPSKISPEKIKQAEEENDRLRAEKVAKRAETIERINRQREQRIAEQERQKAQIELTNSFKNDNTPLTLTTKPKSKEERKEVRDRARKARQKRSDKVNQPSSGDLSSLIDEVSSRGNSICSDLSLDHPNLNQSLNASHNFSNFVNYPQNHETFNNNNFQQAQAVQASAAAPLPPPPNNSFATYPNQPPPASNVGDNFVSTQPPAEAHTMQKSQQNPSAFLQNQSVSNHSQISHNQQSQNFHEMVPPSNDWSENHFSSNNQGQFFDQFNDGKKSYEQIDKQSSLETDYHHNMNLGNAQHSQLPVNETEGNEQLYMHYDYSGTEYNTDINKEVKPEEIQGIRTSEESQSGGSSGSASSYAMVASVKSSESDSRLSPYQFVDSTIYPSQSSLNSNESSPLEIQNMSTTSTYDKVSLPSGTISSFEMTSGSSSDIPLHSTSSVVEAIEEAIEPLPEQPEESIPQKEVNPILENKKLLQQKAAALFHEARQMNQHVSASSSTSQSLENQSNFSAPSSPNPVMPPMAMSIATNQASDFFNEGHPLYQPHTDTEASGQTANVIESASRDFSDGPSQYLPSQHQMPPEAPIDCFDAVEQYAPTQSTNYQSQQFFEQPPELISNPLGSTQQHILQSPPDVVPSATVPFQIAAQASSERVDQPEVLMHSHGNSVPQQEEFLPQQNALHAQQHTEGNEFQFGNQQQIISERPSLSPKMSLPMVNQSIEMTQPTASSYPHLQQVATDTTTASDMSCVQTGVQDLTLSHGALSQTNSKHFMFQPDVSPVATIASSGSAIPSSSQHLFMAPDSLAEQPPYSAPTNIPQMQETANNTIQTAGQFNTQIENLVLYSAVQQNPPAATITQPSLEIPVNQEVVTQSSTVHPPQNIFQPADQTLDLTKAMHSDKQSVPVPQNSIQSQEMHQPMSQQAHAAYHQSQDPLTVQQLLHQDPNIIHQSLPQQTLPHQQMHMSSLEPTVPVNEPLKLPEPDISKTDTQTPAPSQQQSVIDELFGRSASKPKVEPVIQEAPQPVQFQPNDTAFQPKIPQSQPVHHTEPHQEMSFSNQNAFTQQLTSALENHQQNVDQSLNQVAQQVPQMLTQQQVPQPTVLPQFPNVEQLPVASQQQIVDASQQLKPSQPQLLLQHSQNQQQQQLQQQMMQHSSEQQQPQLVQGSNENLVAPQVTTPVSTVAPVNLFQTPTPQPQQGLESQSQQAMYAQQQPGMYQQPSTPTATMTQEQQAMMTQYYQQMGYTPQQISMMMQQYQYDPTGGMQGYGNDYYNQMWYQQQQQYMQQMYYYNYWQAAYSSYPSSVASSAYGDSRPGSVIERRSSRSSDRGLSEIGDLTSELSFANRSASPAQEEIVKQRSTPLSFTRPHIKAHFNKTGGILNVVAPRQPLDGEIAMVQNVSIENIVAIPMLKRFPGPLLRGDTNKKQINNFIVETIKIHLPKLYGNNKNELFAHIALWEFVGLLVKQNGTFDGSDVADMLINLLPTSQSSDGRDYKGFSALCNPQHVPDETAVEEMQLLLATGRTKDGLDHAIQSGLWGHAFMLGTLMGHKYLATVQNKFSATINRTDPMKTLYTHLANKDPTSIKKRVHADTWVHNLCMLISQPTNHGENDRQKLLCFGDALRDLGLVAASHLCYLVANEVFGCHRDSGSRMVLLGQEHKTYTDKSANVWIDPLHVQLTEIYQYARTLHEKAFVIPNFQQYKYEYAMQLVDYGYSPQALAYLESIGEAICSDQTYQLYNKRLCTNIVKHANRMILQETERYKDFDSPDWVKHVENYAANSSHTVPLQQQKTKETANISSSRSPDITQNHVSSTEPPFSPIWPDTSRSGDTSSDVVSHGNNDTPFFQPVQGQQYVQEETMSQWQQNDTNDSSAWQQQKDVDQIDTIYQNQNEVITYDYSSANYGEENGVQQHINHDSYGTNNQIYGSDEYSYQQPHEHDEGDHHSQYEQQPVEEIGEEEGDTAGETDQPPFQPYYPSVSQKDMQSAPTFFNPSQTASTFGNPYQPSLTETAEEPSTGDDVMANPQYADDAIEDEEDLFGGFKKQSKADKKGAEQSGDKVKESVKKEETKKKEIPAQTSSSGGMFETIKGLFKRKEVYLPDDTNKSLVYDKEKKRWIDKNADPNDEPAPPPPPPTGGMGLRATPSAATPMNMSSTTTPSIPTVSMSASPPSFGITGPGRPGLSRRNTSNLSKRSSNTEILPQMESTGSSSIKTPSEPKEQTIRSETNSTGGQTLLEQSKEKKEEDKKPAGPPSMFSLKAQGGRKGLSRYATAPNSISTKSTPMAPVLDPFGKDGNKSVNGSAPGNMAFFTPGAPQKSARRLDQN